ncbi:hypothetical protein AnigIFM59636_007513 [Aspergillus niger]|nr:hypothetical protein AnigIFM59636_007513 [Aspergillus niger]
MDKKYKGRMKVDDRPDGLYMRIVAQHVGRGRSRERFRNARSVHDAFARITERGAKRLQGERTYKRPTDDLILTKEDLLDADPCTVLTMNATWDKLQALPDLRHESKFIQAFFDTVLFNYQRELEQGPMVELSLNKILVEIQAPTKPPSQNFALSVVVKTPSDFIGNGIGCSDAVTKGILAPTLGKVLVIDEAYMLGGTSSASDGVTGLDIFKTAVIYIPVAQTQSVPGDGRCVRLWDICT